MREKRNLVALGLLTLPALALASSEGGLGNLISVAPGSMLWTILTFLLLLLVLWKFAWGPILKGLDAREEKIKGAIDSAQRDRDEAAKLLREYEEKLKTASAEISERLKKADKDASSRIEQATNDARTQAEQLLEKAKQEIEAQQQRASIELRTEVVNLAAAIASKSIGESFTREDHLRVIKKKLEQLEAKS
ncbi:F0F1 ATP synthase subunit B [bacterium]|nr:F0F1 ATP synthase subunit B [bacterium]